MHKLLLIYVIALLFALILRRLWLLIYRLRLSPDGTKLELFASGDEFHNWLHDKIIILLSGILQPDICVMQNKMERTLKR